MNQLNNTATWQYPLSLILALAFLICTYILWRYLPQGRLRRALSGKALCLTSIIAVVAMTAVEGTWSTPLHHHPAFWASALLMMLSLQFALMDEIRRRKGIARIASHAGMFLLAFGTLWGSPDIIDTQMLIAGDMADNTAYTRHGQPVMLPFSIRLQEFRIDVYDDGVSPKQFTSLMKIDGKEYETSVNHPCYYKGFYIYQSDFDHERGLYSIIKVIADPWLPVIYMGMALLALGAFLRMRLDWHSRWLTVSIVLVAILFAVLSVARINFGTLMPALRSWWFVPHLVLYMLAYSGMALALVLKVASMAGIRSEQFAATTTKLFNTSSSLMLLGMLCGSVWAKAAWGDWWMWDAKECWAAVTWLLTLVGIHLPHRMRHRDAALIVSMLLAFLAMQIAWYGVEHLPSAANSMHTYK